MANTKLAVLGMLVMILQAASCTVARRHATPGPCGAGDDGGCPSSPPVLSSKIDGIPAVMTVNGFEPGESGGGPAECDGQYHNDRDMLVALSTGWYEGGRRCQRAIHITSPRTGRTVEAMVVDECDSRHGCKDNIVDTSPAVWGALGLDTNVGEVPVTWSDA